MGGDVHDPIIAPGSHASVTRKMRLDSSWFRRITCYSQVARNRRMHKSLNEGPSHPTPGRWVGGLIGVVACMITGLAAGVIGNGFLSASSLVLLVVGGLPIAFLGGRGLLPAARSGGWLEACAVGLIFGMI